MAYVLQLASASLEWRRVGEEIVILNTQTARYLALNRTGSMLWPLLNEGADEAALTAGLVERYGLDAGQARADVTAFVAQLAEYGLLESFGVPRP